MLKTFLTSICLVGMMSVQAQQGKPACCSSKASASSTEDKVTFYSEHLGLNAKQVTQVREILEHSTKATTDRATTAELEAKNSLITQEKIAALLNEDQKKAFAKLTRESAGKADAAGCSKAAAAGCSHGGTQTKDLEFAPVKPAPQKATM